MNYPIILARNLTKNPQNRGIGVFVLGKSNRGEGVGGDGVGRKGRVIEESAKGKSHRREGEREP